MKTRTLVVSPVGVAEWVCRETGIKVSELKVKNRAREIVAAKALIFYGLRTYCDMPFKKIATAYNLDHSSVIHHIDKFNNGTYEHDSLIAPIWKKMKVWYQAKCEEHSELVEAAKSTTIISTALNSINMPLVIKAVVRFHQYLDNDFKKGALDTEGVEIYHSVKSLIG